MNSPTLKYSFLFVFVVLLQVLFLNQVQFSGYLNPFIYILFILLLPLDTPRYVSLFSAFLLGLTIDIFSNSMGTHAAATVFIAYLRPAVVQSISTKRDDDRNFYPGLKQYGFNWFFTYALILTFLHHLIFFTLEIFTFHNYYLTLYRILLSTIFSVFVIVLSQFIIFRNKAT